MTNDDEPQTPDRNQRSGQERREGWNKALTDAALRELTDAARKLEDSGAPFTGCDVAGDMKGLAAKVAIPRTTFDRRRRQGELTTEWLDQRLADLAAEAIDEHRFPVIHQDAIDWCGLDLVLLGLALHAARPRSGDAASTRQHYGAARAGALIGLATDVRLNDGRGLTDRDIEHVERHHSWLATLAEQHRSSSPDIVGTRCRLAGFLAGWRAKVAAPDEVPGEDRSGYWAEGVIEALMHRVTYAPTQSALAALNLLGKFATGPVAAPSSSAPMDRSVLNVTEYAVELLVVRILAGPATSRVVREAEALAQRLLEQVDAWNLPEHDHDFLTRRVKAARHFVLRNPREALLAAVLRNDQLVRPAVEHEYAFGLLAAIAHDAQCQLDDEREQYTLDFLAKEVERGRGPFLPAPVRSLVPAAVVGQLPDASELAEDVADLVPDHLVRNLDRAVQLLAIARAFNTTHNRYPREKLADLAVQLRERAALVDSAALQLELLAADS